MSEEWTYTPKTAAEIETLSWDILGGRVFGSWSCPPEQLAMSFMILGFMEVEQLNNLTDQGVVHVYEYIDKAGPSSVNGYPSFFSAHYINNDDWKKVILRITQIKDFQKATAPT